MSGLFRARESALTLELPGGLSILTPEDLTLIAQYLGPRYDVDLDLAGRGLRFRRVDHVEGDLPEPPIEEAVSLALWQVLGIVAHEVAEAQQKLRKALRSAKPRGALHDAIGALLDWAGEPQPSGARMSRLKAHGYFRHPSAPATGIVFELFGEIERTRRASFLRLVMQAVPGSAPVWPEPDGAFLNRALSVTDAFRKDLLPWGYRAAAEALIQPALFEGYAAVFVSLYPRIHGTVLAAFGFFPSVEAEALWTHRVGLAPVPQTPIGWGIRKSDKR